MHPLFVCFFHSRPRPVYLNFDHFPLIFIFFCDHISLFFHCHLTLTAPITICQHLCPNLVPLSHSQRKLYKRLQTFLPHSHFCCRQAASCCFVMFRGKVPLKCYKAFMKRERRVCLHMGDVVAVVNSLLCALEAIKNITLQIDMDITTQVLFLSAF